MQYKEAQNFASLFIPCIKKQAWHGSRDPHQRDGSDSLQRDESDPRQLVGTSLQTRSSEGGVYNNIYHKTGIKHCTIIIFSGLKTRYSMKKISRKEFITKTGAGIVSLGLVSGRSFKSTEEKPLMNKLGNTGILVTPLCFGASRTNDEGLIRFAIDRGINFLDTGRSYARGNNERLVGRAIKGKRKDIVIQSKMHLEPDELKYEGRGRRGHDEIKEVLEKRIAESLEALDTDYIDIMLFHSADQEYLTYHEAVLEFYDKQKQNGIIKAHGFSSHDYSLGLLKKNNTDNFYDIIMHPFNFKGGFTHSLSGWSARWEQDILLEELEKAASMGTGIVAMKTCSAGPYSSNGKDEPTYRQAVEWVLQHPFVHSAAVAMVNYEQVRNYTT